MADFKVLSTDNVKDDDDSAARSAKAIGIIASALDVVAETGNVTCSTEDARVLPIAWGWFVYIVRSAQLVALASENGLRHECGPNSRVIIQYTMALQWLSEVGDAGADVVEKAAEVDRYKLVKELTDTNWPTPAGFSLTLPATRPTIGGKLFNEYDNFKDMVKLYDDGPQLYVPYKLQSSYIHPSYVGARAYLTDNPPRLAVQADTDTFANLLDTTRCVIQAARVLSGLIINDTTLSAAITEAQDVWGAEIGLWQRTTAV